MSLRSFTSKIVRDFRGMWLVRDQTRQSTSRASYAQNVRFTPGGVKSRVGFSQILDLGSASILSMYNWLTATTSRLVYLESPNIVAMYDLLLSAPIALYTQACQGISVTEAETRLYIAHYTSAGVATGQLKVVNALLSGSPVDNAMPAPMSDTFTVNDVGAGTVSEGLHYFAYRLETRTGFPGKPAPYIASVFTPVSSTVAAGGRSLTLTMTINIPSDGAIIHALMTPVDDPDTYYDVPGSGTAVPAGGVAWPVTIPIDISDAALIQGTDATDRFSYITGGLVPSKVGRYGNRTYYVVDKKLYISDPYNSQVLIEDQHAVQVEGQRVLSTAEPLRSQLVIFGYHSTYVLGGDNNRVPRQWAPPQRVSESIGTRCPNGVIPAAGFEFLWVVHESGLYVFNGAYGEIPVSRMFESDWKRINWAVAATIQMVDNPIERCLYILVPLNADTTPKHRMVIDYTRAKASGTVNPFEVDYVLDVYEVSDVATALPSVAMVQHPTTKVRELWFGRTDGTVVRRDESVVADAGQKIHAIWESGLCLGAKSAQINRFGGVQLDVKGTGTMTVTPYGLNKQVTADADVQTLALEASPDGESEVRWHLASENQSIRIETDAVAASFEVNGMKIYYRPVGSTKAP